MANPLTWLEALAGFKALYDLVSGAPDYYASLKRHREEKATIEAAHLANRLSTFSDKELEELIRKIEACRDRFIQQGSGKDRAKCLCSIFNEIMDGNGGEMPDIDAWREMYAQLRCSRLR